MWHDFYALPLSHLTWPVYILLLVGGLCIGSFLNVVISRLPLMLFSQDSENAACTEANTCPTSTQENPTLHATKINLAWPPSHCPYCHHQLRLIDLIPLVSYLMLKARCYHCKQSISTRYPLIEIITGLITVSLVWYFGLNAKAFFSIIFSYILLALATIDNETGLLPDHLTLSGLWLGLLLSTGSVFVPPEQAIMGAAIGYLFLRSVAFLYYILRKQHGMGLGDCKLLAMLGAWVGPYYITNIIALASVCALTIALLQWMLQRSAFSRSIAFGPYLALAGWLIFLFQLQSNIIIKALY